MKNNQTGRSMVEMLGVLAIIGVLSAGGLAGYSKAMFKHKLNSTMDQITMLVTNIRTMYGAQGNYYGLAEDAIKLGIVPAVMGSAMGSLTNPFKGDVTIHEAMATDATTDSGSKVAGSTAFILTYTGLPIEACIALATSDFGSGAGSGFIGVVAANGDSAATAKTKKVGDSTEGTAYAMNAAITACRGESNTKDVSSVSWKFY